MKITATHIIQWADARAAQSLLPILVRRLVSQVNATKALSFPGGDSVFRPGWGDYCETEQGNAWVPSGISCWEMGCNRNPQSKANEDFGNRVDELNRDGFSSVLALR